MSRVAVHQLVASLHAGDAVRNEARNIQRLLRGAGHASEIYAVRCDTALRSEAVSAEWYGRGTGRDVCLYHFAAGSPAGRIAAATDDRLVVNYHNVTPPEFFLGFDTELVRLCHHGRRELRALSARADFALAKSEFSRRELRALGYSRTAVLPYVMAPRSLAERASPVVGRLYSDGRDNVLSVGRIVPNKRLENLLRAFASLRRSRPRSRLLIVGDTKGQEAYVSRLQELAKRLRLGDVVFTGRVDDDDLRAYYRVASVLVSLSAHEGYGVPLREAMLLDVPVIAWDAGALAETLQGGGVLVRDASPLVVGELIARVLEDPALRAAVLETQRPVARRLETTDFSALLLERLSPVLGPSA